jgi:hypothetical protein
MSERWLLIRRRSRQRRQSRLLRRRLQHRNDARPDFSHSPIWCAGSGLEELRMSVWKLSATDRRALNLRATASPLPKLAQTGCWEPGRACPLCPGISDINLFRYCQGIIHFDAKISNGTFDLGVAK